jgi:hypothetical protein
LKASRFTAWSGWKRLLIWCGGWGDELAISKLEPIQST